MYASFLARTLSPSSIPAYMNIIKLIHEEGGFPNPLCSWELQAVSKGIKRTLGKPPNQKLPITLDILHRIYEQLDLSEPSHIAFWAASLVAFFAFLRKSTLLPKSQDKKDISKSLYIRDLVLTPDKSMMKLTIRHTKTIQFGQRELQIPIAKVHGSVLCPVSAVVAMLALIPPCTPPADFPLFCYKSQGDTLTHLTHTSFVSMLKQFIKCAGMSSAKFSGHSFRRGGCTHAFRLGISPLLIKLRGDWRSNAYERYVTIQNDQHLAFASALSASVH